MEAYIPHSRGEAAGARWVLTNDESVNIPNEDVTGHLDPLHTNEYVGAWMDMSMVVRAVMITRSILHQLYKREQITNSKLT